MCYADEKAVDELGAVGRTKLSCRSFRAFTVLLIGIFALGARYTPEMYTIGVNPLSELLNAHVTSWWLSFFIIISVLTFTDPARTSSDTPPVLVSARLPDFEGPLTVYIFHPASSTQSGVYVKDKFVSESGPSRLEVLGVCSPGVLRTFSC